MLGWKIHVRMLLDGASSWDALRLIGNSWLVKLTIIVPILGYMILFNDQLTTYFELSKHYVNDLVPGDGPGGVPAFDGVAYRLYCFYFGFTFLALGVLVYHIRCPRLVRLYGSAAEYYRVEGPTTTDSQLRRLAVPLLKQRFGAECAKVGLDPVDVWLANLPEGVSKAFDMRLSMERDLRTLAVGAESAKAFIMMSHFVPLKVAHPWGRWLVLSSYALAFAFLTVPTALTFASVVRSVANRL